MGLVPGLSLVILGLHGCLGVFQRVDPVLSYPAAWGPSVSAVHCHSELFYDPSELPPPRVELVVEWCRAWSALLASHTHAVRLAGWTGVAFSGSGC